MPESKGITTTSNLRQLIQNMPPRQYNAVLDMVQQRIKEFRKAWTKNGKIGFVKAFYETFDITLKAKVQNVSCKKGCHFCCRINVDISDAEAALISEYCQSNNIAIPKAKLEEQLKYDIKEIAATEVGWCIFLRGGGMFNISC